MGPPIVKNFRVTIYLSKPRFQVVPDKSSCLAMIGVFAVLFVAAH